MEWGSPCGENERRIVHTGRLGDRKIGIASLLGMGCKERCGSMITRTVCNECMYVTVEVG